MCSYGFFQTVLFHNVLENEVEDHKTVELLLMWDEV